MSERRRGSILDTIKSPLSNDLPNWSSSEGTTNEPFELNTSIWNSNSNFSKPAAASPFDTYTPPRRASDAYSHQQQQNYTVWSNTLNPDSSVTPTSNEGNWNTNKYSPRRFSLDSYASTLPFNYEGSKNSNQLNSNMGYIDSLSPPPSQKQTLISESTPQLSQVYQQLDFYFVQDPHKRISITVDSLNSNGFDNFGSQITLPKFQNTNSLPSQQLVLVSFKCGRIDCFYVPENCSLNLKIGDLVIVEADRGKDLGRIVKLDVSIDDARLLKYLQFMEQQAALNSFSGPSSNPNSMSEQGGGSGSGSNVPTLHFPKPVIRLAHPQEVMQLLTKLSDEEKAKKICLFKIESIQATISPNTQTSQAHSDIHGNMQIIDAEYQFDRRKLTFYYAANHRIDFRDLVRDLFRVYKTRIWMCAVNTAHHINAKNPDHPAEEFNEVESGDNSFGGFQFNQNIWSSTNQFKPTVQNLTPTSPQQQQPLPHIPFGQVPPSSPNTGYGFDYNNNFNNNYVGTISSGSQFNTGGTDSGAAQAGFNWGYKQYHETSSGLGSAEGHFSGLDYGEFEPHHFHQQQLKGQQQQQQQQQFGDYGMNLGSSSGRSISHSIWN